MPPERISAYDLLEIKAIFRQYVDENFRYANEAARYFGVSSQYIDTVMKDKYEVTPNQAMLEAIGYLREKHVFIKSKCLKDLKTLTEP